MHNRFGILREARHFLFFELTRGRASSISDIPFILPQAKGGPGYSCQFSSFLTQDLQPLSLARGTWLLMWKNSSRGPQTPAVPHDAQGSVSPTSNAGPHASSQLLQPIPPASPARSRGPGLWLQSQPQEAFFRLFLSSSSCMEHGWSSPCTHFTHISSFTPTGKLLEVTSLSPLTKEEEVLRVEPR